MFQENPICKSTEAEGILSLRELEDALFTEWRQRRPKMVLDGVVDEANYNESSPKILYLLKEVNGGECWDLRDYLKNGGTKRTWSNVARWTHGIRELYAGIKPDSLKWKYLIEKNEDFRPKQLCSICAVNVKKDSGHHTADNNLLAKYADEDKDLLLRQLAIYNPDITICCNIGHPESNLKWEMTTRGISYACFGSSIIIYYVHPEVRCPASIAFYGLMDAIYEIRTTTVKP